MKYKLLLTATISAVLAWGCIDFTPSDDKTNTGNETGVNNGDNETPDIPDLPEEPETPAVIEFTSQEKETAQKMEQFNAEFFATVCAECPDGNLVVSPLSTSILLSMASNYADVAASEEIAVTLGSDSYELNALAAKYGLYLPVADPTQTVELENALWHSDRYTINPDFQQILSDAYRSEATSLDIDNQPLARSIINQWGLEKSHGWIESLIGPTETVGEHVAASSLYFNGAWAKPFDPSKTKKETFHGALSEAKVDMMSAYGAQLYSWGDGFQAIKLIFGAGKYEAVFVLPNPDQPLEALLTSEKISEIANLRFYGTPRINLHLPKFRIGADSRLDLRNVFMAMGMPSLCETQTLGLFNVPVQGKLNIFQKSGIEFNEQGAEGAAITWDNGLIATNQDIEINFNRPFLFFVNETTAGGCLFAGRVLDL